jgi:hypothetical protein
LQFKERKKMKFNKPSSEIGREQVEEIIRTVHDGDVHRERGGIIKKGENGKVTEEPNTGGRFCRSMLILDTDSFDWENVAALWISNEIPPGEGYVDDCCNRCITAEEAKIKVPRLDFVTPAQGGWADAFKVPVIVYQPKSKLEMGYFDHYDPTGKTVGINCYPQSPRAGIARKDPKTLTATAREAVRFIAEREALITAEWIELAKEYEYQENRCLATAMQTLGELESLSVCTATAVEKIKACQSNQVNIHAVAPGNPYHRKVQATQNQQAAETNHLLSPCADPFEFPDVLGVPIQAYANWRG